ncbi:hypothetical protein ACET3Z_012060 [Daucus carota]
MDKYEFVKDIGVGSFGSAKLMRNKATQELVAMKFIERGSKINTNVEREIINHRSLIHPNIVRFKQVLLTPTHLVIEMEYAAGGELFDRIVMEGRFSENEARYFFQQLISGVSYCHFRNVCHRDLKLANTLLDGSPVPILKICDFGFSKSSMLHSRPKSIAGTLRYIAPEILSGSEYSGKMADVWSCGVTLYIMLVGAYPFEDQKEPRNYRKTVQRILGAQYKIPDVVYISQDCRHLLSRILVAPASRRITIEEIKNHPWFLKNLPWKESEAAQGIYYWNDNSTYSSQSLESIMEIVREARKPATNPPSVISQIKSQPSGKEPEAAKGLYNRKEKSASSSKRLESRKEVNEQEENVEHVVEEEEEFDKKVKEVYEDKQVKEVDEDKQMNKEHEDNQVKEAYKCSICRNKMIKMLCRTSLFLTYAFLQISWYQ